MEYLREVLVGGGTAVALLLLMWAAVRGAPEVTADGTLRFQYPALFRGMANFFAFGVPIGLTGLLFLFPPKAGDALPILFLYALFVGLGFPLWWEATRFFLIVSPTGLRCRSPWRGEQFIPWTELEEVSYSSLNRWFVLHAWAGRKARVSIYVAGIVPFLEICEEHLPASAFERARAGYMEVGRALPV